jgi:hypothetical protein
MRASWGFVPLLHRDYEGQTSSVIFFSYYFSFLLCTCNQELQRNYFNILVETKVIDYLLSVLFILVLGKTFTSAEKEMRMNHKSPFRFAHMLLFRYLLTSLTTYWFDFLLYNSFISSVISKPTWLPQLPIKELSKLLLSKLTNFKHIGLTSLVFFILLYFYLLVTDYMLFRAIRLLTWDFWLLTDQVKFLNCCIPSSVKD